MEHKTNVWDIITAMAGGAISTTIFGKVPVTIMDFEFWRYSTEAGLFALKAAVGAIIAIFFKKMGEDIYAWAKKKITKQ